MNAITNIFNDASGGIRAKVIGIYALLIAFNVGAWVWALAAFGDSPALLGTAFLAYSFGLRHAFDADHIAAIDNVTRKLMQEGKRPLAVGLMFSLGHSTIVLIGSLLIASTALVLQHRVDAFRSVGGVIGTLVSTLFLLGIRLAPSVRATSTSIGWLQQCSSFGQFAGPPLVAWVATQAGGWQWTWLATGLCALGGIAMATRLGKGKV